MRRSFYGTNLGETINTIIDFCFDKGWAKEVWYIGDIEAGFKIMEAHDYETPCCEKK